MLFNGQRAQFSQDASLSANRDPDGLMGNWRLDRDERIARAAAFSLGIDVARAADPAVPAAGIANDEHPQRKMLEHQTGDELCIVRSPLIHIFVQRMN